MATKDIPSHHLIYGTCKDFITGEELVDTDDERFRQKIARLLVEEKEWDKKDIMPRQKIETLFASTFVVSRIDFLVNLDQKPFMIIRYGPGSIVTRERPAVAAARVLLPDVRVPIAVVTNGTDAVILETLRGRQIAGGMDAIPSKEEAEKLIADFPQGPFPEEKRERELRILNACDTEVCCTGGPLRNPRGQRGLTGQRPGTGDSLCYIYIHIHNIRAIPCPLICISYPISWQKLPSCRLPLPAGTPSDRCPFSCLQRPLPLHSNTCLPVPGPEL